MPLQMAETLRRIFKIMEYIKQHPDCSIKEVSDSLGISPTTVRLLVNALQDVGLVTRTIEPMPRRSKIRLTPKGECIIKCLQNIT